VVQFDCRRADESQGDPHAAAAMRRYEVQLTVLIPVYNEAQTVADVLDKTESALAGVDHEVIVVDDCSTDGSRELIRAWAEDHAAVHVLLHDKNRGKGAAIRTGLDVARGTYFVVQDADLEYDPTDIPRLLAVADGHQAVYGSRFMGSISGMKVTNRIANRFYNIVLRVLYGVKITDMHTCYKMVPTATLCSFDIQSQGFDYATEVISKLLLSQVPIEEVAISYHGRSVEEGKKIGWRDGWDCLRLILRYRFEGRRQTAPAQV
jgi:glycosyltransferase involved in cell wall biosynthesis